MYEDKNFCDRTREEVEEPVELESQFILRLPRAAATSLRHSLESGALNLQKRLKIKIEEDRKHCKVVYDGWSLTGRVMDSPTVIECLKTLDRKVFYKAADICQILICEDGDVTQELDEENSTAKMYLLPYGITAPLKNVRRRRFRKTLKKLSPEVPDHEKEVKLLFQTDLEATSVRYELVSADEGKQQMKSEGNDFSAENSMDAPETLPVGEAELFGEMSSSSEESEVDEESAANLCQELMDHGVDVLNCQDFPMELPEDVLEFPETENSKDMMEKENASVLQRESETAGENLGLLLQEQIMEDEKAVLRKKAVLCKKADHLRYQISSMQNKQRDLEQEILAIGNEALRERFQSRIDHLKQEICEKQAEYNNIVTAL